ncbi:MAG: preprotein translocase subunit SecD [Methanomicrobiales archaeon]|nr:preprotein translocase subunit SecD [Methanomicrobiales archaeon]
MTREEWVAILKNWQVALVLALLVLSLIAIAPWIEGGKPTTSLQFGLDLEGGSWLQLEFRAVVVGFQTTMPQDAFLEDLGKRLDTEVLLIGENQIEIRKFFTRDELDPLVTEAGGRITSYEMGVSQATSSDVKRILEEKLNSLGTKDARVNTLTSLSGITRYVRVELAGVDMATAQDIVGKQGKFEIRIQRTANETEHVLYGDQITYVGLPQKNPQQGTWGVSFSMSDQGADAFRQACIQHGAVDNPDAHPLLMILDNVTVYNAPLNPQLAQKLKTGPERQLIATTGAGENGLNEAMKLEIHLRAGALPVDVAIAGSGTVPALMGEQFKLMSLAAGILALITVGLVVLYRYREPSIVLPMVLINASEVVILLGISRFFLQLDLATIAGLIAVLGTGIDQLVIVTDEVLHEGKVPSPSLYMKRLSRAVGIIVVSAATVFIAMLPLVIIDLSTLRGFALVTILGTLIGVLITRPAYGHIIMGILSRKGA